MKIKTETISLSLIFAIQILFSVPAEAFTIQLGTPVFETGELVIHLDPTDCPSNISNDLDYTIDFWNGAPQTSLFLERGNDVTVGAPALIAMSYTEEIVVGCLTNFTAALSAPDSALGAGSGADTTGDGLRDRGRVVINMEAGTQGFYGTQDEKTRLLVMTHEMGHVFGLSHSGNERALMYWSTNNKTGVNLHQDDIDGIRHLYPQNELEGEYLLGCGSIATLRQTRPPKTDPKKVLLIFLLLTLPTMQTFLLKSKLKFKGLPN